MNQLAASKQYIIFIMPSIVAEIGSRSKASITVPTVVSIENIVNAAKTF